MMTHHAPSQVPADPAPRWTLDVRGKHINHGSFGAVPADVQAEQERLRRLIDWNPVRWFSSLPPRIAAARAEMAELLDVDPSHTAFVLNASAGATSVFDRYVATTAVNVMVTNHGYGAISMGAERLARRTGGTYTTLDIPLDTTADDVLALVVDALQRHGTTLLVIDQITSATARAFPVDDICRRARELGVTTLVDGAHAPGVLPSPVCKEADYWVGNLHKFVCAPRGAALLWSRDSDQALFPVIDSWGARLPFPERFDHTGTLDTTAWLVAPFAWRHIEDSVGWDTVRTRSVALADEATALLADALRDHVEDPVPDVGQPVGPMRLVRLPEGLGRTREEADAMRVPFIDATGIALSFTSFDGRGYLRLSTHIYNSINDFEYLAKVGVPLLHRWSTQATRGTQPSSDIEEDACVGS